MRRGGWRGKGVVRALENPRGDNNYEPSEQEVTGNVLEHYKLREDINARCQNMLRHGRMS